MQAQFFHACKNTHEVSDFATLNCYFWTKERFVFQASNHDIIIQLQEVQPHAIPLDSTELSHIFSRMGQMGQ